MPTGFGDVAVFSWPQAQQTTTSVYMFAPIQVPRLVNQEMEEPDIPACACDTLHRCTHTLVVCT